MNVLHLEGTKNNIRINTLGPGAATRMTADLLPKAIVDLMTPASVAPAAVYLVSEDAPSRVILSATAGGFSRTYLHETEGVYLGGSECTAEGVAAHFDAISDTAGQKALTDGGQQVMKFVTKAATAMGVNLTPPKA